MSQVELFLNSVPILSPLTKVCLAHLQLVTPFLTLSLRLLDVHSKEERMQLVDALEEMTYPAGTKVIVEGDRGNHLFYIVKDGACAWIFTAPSWQSL